MMKNALKCLSVLLLYCILAGCNSESTPPDANQGTGQTEQSTAEVRTDDSPADATVEYEYRSPTDIQADDQQPSPVQSARRAQTPESELSDEEILAAIRQLEDKDSIKLLEPPNWEAGIWISLNGNRNPNLEKVMEYVGRLTNLKKLSFGYINVLTDIGLKDLRGLMNLRRLKLKNTNVTEEGVQKLQQDLPKCWIMLKK